MSELVDNLADLTSQKDRDALERALVGTICDLLSPISEELVRHSSASEGTTEIARARIAALRCFIGGSCGQCR